jgi:hypothetical protein
VSRGFHPQEVVDAGREAPPAGCHAGHIQEQVVRIAQRAQCSTQATIQEKLTEAANNGVRKFEGRISQAIMNVRKCALSSADEVVRSSWLIPPTARPAKRRFARQEGEHEVNLELRRG